MGLAADPTREVEKETRQIFAAVTACFFCSGATGLIYEVLWTRILGLVFGHTVFAITTVLAAFMAGLGLGSYLFGGVADRNSRPLRLYGFLEVGIGVYALTTPFLFSRAEDIYIPLHRAFGLSFFTFSLLQFLLIFVILLIPTTLMGATLPVLSRFFVRSLEVLGGQVGRLYALNTFGAVLGTYAAGFHLIPTLGVKTTLLLAAVANIGIGALAVVFDRHLYQLGRGETAGEPAKAPAASARESNPAVPAPERPSAVAVWLTVAGLGISGAVSMMYEVAWTRVLALVIGSSTYAFSTMLVTFLTGLALGSYLYSRVAGRLWITPRFFGGLQLGIGLSALLVTPLFDRMPEIFLRLFQISQSPGFMKALQFFISALAMFVPTLFMGATFPCAIQIASTAVNRVGRDVGRVYFVNTGGAIVGTVVAGFGLIPFWGLQATLQVAVSLNLCLALALFLTSRRPVWRQPATVVVPILALGALYLSPTWDAGVMTSGVAIYGRSYFGRLGTGNFRGAASPDRLLYYKDGLSATVSVHRQRELVYMRVNGKTDASNGGDMHTQLMSGHLPMLIRPDAKRVLVIGMGSGVTAGAVGLHPTDRIDLIEIEPAVVEAAAFFAKENREILKNPKARVAIADGRNFLLASDENYDVIISEPSNPWMRGIGNLFSLDFYELVARRLAPRGIVCQWIHIYGLFPEDVKMVVKTFRSVFPHTAIWNTNIGDLLLLGSKEPWTLDNAVLQTKYEASRELREDMARLGIRSPLAILADFVLTEEEAAAYSRHALVNTDDLPILEFSAPDSLYADTLDLNWRILKSFGHRPLPPLLNLSESAATAPELQRDLGLVFWAKDRFEEARLHFERALRDNPKDIVALLYRGKIHARSASVLLAEADFKAALGVDSRSIEAHETLAQLYREQRMWDAAEVHLREIATLRPNEARHLAALADFVRERGRFDEAIQRYLTALTVAPEDSRLRIGLGLAYRGSGRYAEAIEVFGRVVSSEPENAFAYYQLGVANLEAKRTDEAWTALRTASLKDPFRPGVWLALGRLHALRGDAAAALEAFHRCLRLEPLNTDARKAIEEVSATLYNVTS